MLCSCCTLSTCNRCARCCGCRGGGASGGGRSLQFFLPNVGPFWGVGIARGARGSRLFGRILSRAAPLPLGGGGVGVVEEILRGVVVGLASHPSGGRWDWRRLLLTTLHPGGSRGGGGPLLSHLSRLHLLVLLEHLLLMERVRVLLHRPTTAAAAVHLVHLLLPMLLLLHHLLLLLDLLLLEGLRMSHVGSRRWRGHRCAHGGRWILAGIRYRRG